MLVKPGHVFSIVHLLNSPTLSTKLRLLRNYSYQSIEAFGFDTVEILSEFIGSLIIDAHILEDENLGSDAVLLKRYLI